MWTPVLTLSWDSHCWIPGVDVSFLFVFYSSEARRAKEDGRSLTDICLVRAWYRKSKGWCRVNFPNSIVVTKERMNKCRELIRGSCLYTVIIA